MTEQPAVAGAPSAGRVRDAATALGYALILRLDYGVLLPLCAALPMPLGRNLARLRGLCNFILDLDWRSLALRHRYVRRDTYCAMRQLKPDASPRRAAINTLRRFVHYSREEWEAGLFQYKRRVRALSAASTVEGLAPLLALTRSGRGLVLLTMHFDSFLLGVTLLGLKGLRMHVTTASVVENPRLHPSVQRFFQRKYRGIERYLNGGKMVHIDHDQRHFYRALEQGDVVVVLADLPAVSPRAHATVLPLGGQDRRLTTGAFRLARKTDSAIGAFLCSHVRGNHYRVQCTMPRQVGLNTPVQVLEPLYAWFDRHLRETPERWWAADLLLGMPPVQADG